jgi:Cys-tRNA(Pro)/Cys-tRNA(Cys) deacylase
VRYYILKFDGRQSLQGYNLVTRQRHMAIVNNVTRLLDSRKVPYTAYELPAEKLGALETARLLNVEAASVFKTIVVTRDNPTSSPKGKKPLLVVVPGTSTVDLKLVAAALGENKVHLPTEREAEELTGLEAGGISPLALIHKGFQVVIDSSAQEYAEIHVSGGQRGLNLKLPVADLAKLTEARFARVSRPAVDP